MAKDSTKPRLVIIEGKDKGKVISLSPGTTVFGRTKGDVLLHDPRVSRSHLSLSYDERSGKLSYSDLKSLNGLLVNGQASESGVLVDGDRLQVGNTLFDCQLSPATELATAASASDEEPPMKSLNEGSLPLYSPPGKIEPKIEAQVEARPTKPAGAANPAPAPSVPSRDAGPTPMETPEDTDEVTSSHPSPRQRTVPFFNRYRPLTSFRRNALIGIALMGCLYFLFSNETKNEVDFSRQLTSLKQLGQEGRIEEALKRAEDLSKTYDQDEDLWMTLGGLYLQQKRLEPAIRAYLKVKEIDPNNPIATVRLLTCYLRAGLSQEAETQTQELDRLIKEAPHTKEFFLEAANLFLEFRQLPQSPEKILILSRALQNELALDSTIGYRLEAQFMFQQNQMEEAIRAIELGLKRDPQDEWLLENLAFARLSLKDKTGAQEVVENWIRLHPDTTKALLVMAYLRYNEKNFIGALPYLQKIVQIGNSKGNDPHAAEALFLMGQVYLQQSQSVEAKNLFSQACNHGFTAACSASSENVEPSEPSK